MQLPLTPGTPAQGDANSHHQFLISTLHRGTVPACAFPSFGQQVITESHMMTQFHSSGALGTGNSFWPSCLRDHLKIITRWNLLCSL